MTPRMADYTPKETQAVTAPKPAETPTEGSQLKPRAKTGRPRDDERVERGLTALALAGGNSAKASETTGISDSVLRAWRQKHPERYETICQGRAREIDRSLITGFRELALRAREATLAAVDLEHQRLLKGDVRDSAGSARNLATTMAIVTDKTLLLEGRPTQITQHRDVTQLIVKLESLGVVEGTATEIPTRELLAA